MNGMMLTREFLDFIDTRELSDDYIPQRKVYECLDAAAGIFCRETKSIRREAYLTAVAGNQAYDLPPDFIDLYLRSARGRSIIRYYDGSEYSWPSLTTQERIYRENRQTSLERPGHFAIVDKQTSETLVSGNATLAGTVVNGRCVLSDSTKLFTTTDRVWPRDIVYNATDGSMGHVLAAVSATSLYTALFDGTDNDWSLSDGYAIQPAAKKQLFLDAPSLESGHLIHVHYIGMPDPIFSDFDYWRLPARTCRAIAAGAASVFKLGKTEYRESQALGKLFADEIRQFKIEQGALKLKEGPSRRRQRVF